MKRLFSIFCLGMLLLIASSSQSSAITSSPQSYINVIVQTDGSIQSVSGLISQWGGNVTYKYQNLPVLAAYLPAEALNPLYNHPDVIRVAKDHPFKLLDYPDNHRSNYPSSIFSLDASHYTVKSLDSKDLKQDLTIQGYSGFTDSNAYPIWEADHLGDGSVVAVVDTGTVPNVCLKHAVIGAPGYPDGYNATGDGVVATDPSNQWHGTHIGGIIASACALDFSGQVNDPLNQAVSAYLPWNKNWVPIFGQSPEAKIYPVKIFAQGEESTSTAVILDAFDHLLTLKQSGALDIDVINLSFGGPTGFEGQAILDLFLEKFRDENVLVVAAAGNNGPLPNSIASPASSHASIAVGALDYAAASRVFYEYRGLAELGTSGQGKVMRPTDELRVADFSSRGPLSDGRSGPDLVAPGMWSFQFGSQGDFHWDIGTSYAAAVVSGAAALLNGAYETETGFDTPWQPLHNALLLGANREIIGEAWQDPNIAGYGALDAEAAFQILQSGNTHLASPNRSDHLRSNILENPSAADFSTFESGTILLEPSHSYDLLLDISSTTSKVTIDVSNIETPDNSAYAYWANSLKILVQSAKRSAATVPINNYWDPNLSEDHFSITIDDGSWTFAGETFSNQPMEPGLMKVSLIADYANESPISFKLHLTRQQDSSPEAEKPIAQSIINTGDVVNVPVEIPAGTSQATFELVWNRDWLKFPTSDMDLLIFDPSQKLVSLDGATWNAPERVTLANPQPGTWTVQVKASEIYKTDLFRLYFYPESPTGNSDPFDIISQHPATGSKTGTGDDTTSTYTVWIPFIP